MRRANAQQTAAGSVRMGPISLFTLVIVIAIAVMAVLALVTGRASASRAERQAQSMSALYANERAGQAFVAALDERGLELAEAGISRKDALAALSSELPGIASNAALAASTGDETSERGAGHPEVSGQEASEPETSAREPNETVSVVEPALSLDASTGAVTVRFAAGSGRRLDIELALDEGLRPHIRSWKATTEWTEDTSDTVWSGPEA